MNVQEEKIKLLEERMSHLEKTVDMLFDMISTLQRRMDNYYAMPNDPCTIYPYKDNVTYSSTLRGDVTR